MAVFPLRIGLNILFPSYIKNIKICVWDKKMHSSFCVIVIIDNSGTSVEKIQKVSMRSVRDNE